MKNKVITVFITIIILIVILSTNTFARSGYTGIDTDIEIGNTNKDESSKKITEVILGRVQVVGSIISVVALIIIGFRYMFSSLEEKAATKGIMIYYVIGAVLVFATSNILSVIYNILFVKLSI